VVLVVSLTAVATRVTLAGAGGTVDALAWAACAMTFVALVVGLWDRTAAYVLDGLFALGLAAVALVLVHLQPSPRGFGWLAAPAFAAYGLVVAVLVFGAAPFSHVWRAVGLPAWPARPQPLWLFPAEGVLAGGVVALSLWIAADFATTGARIIGPGAAVLLIPAALLLADRAAKLQAAVQWVTLALGVVVTAELGWPFLEPADHGSAWLWLHRSVWVLVAFILMTVVYGVVLARRLPGPGGWAETCRRSGPVLGLLACAALVAVLVQEASLYEGHRMLARLLQGSSAEPLRVTASVAPMAPVAVAVVTVGLLALMGAGVGFAVMPGQDPLGLSERGRKAYVYAAEVLFVLMFAHWRLTRPQVFQSSFFLHFWPFVVMGLAFAGVGLGELFARHRIPVLAEPLERTGVFLPMLPVLAFWVLEPGNYALIWFLTGLLYALLSVTRQSFRYALAGALAANVGLWVTLHHHEVYFWKHPQLWLIPVGVIVLVAEYLNRERLGRPQSAALRYLGLMIVYVSSTADMWLAGLGKSWLLPLVLALLSVAGILAGMLLRVRAFLLLGTTFLTLVILMMIWHAGVDLRHTWILWASGIVLGVAILTLFGIFEKRRKDVLRLIDELRQWD
jgi:hypothetical protein